MAAAEGIRQMPSRLRDRTANLCVTLRSGRTQAGNLDRVLPRALGGVRARGQCFGGCEGDLTAFHFGVRVLQTR